MHYIINNCLIKSENAALSTKQTNKKILEIIDGLKYYDSILDYGCGKCRYARYLSKKAKKLYLTDSKIQLERVQIIENCKTTIKDYASNVLKNGIVFSVEEIDFRKKYDFILCTNVLSAIPKTYERKKVLKNIFKLLKKDGIALLSLQYRNSYFDTYKTNKNACPYNDGWIIKNRNNYSYYAIIPPEKLCLLCEEAGFKIHKKIIVDGSIYVFLKK